MSPHARPQHSPAGGPVRTSPAVTASTTDTAEILAAPCATTVITSEQRTQRATQCASSGRMPGNAASTRATVPAGGSRVAAIIAARNGHPGNVNPRDGAASSDSVSTAGASRTSALTRVSRTAGSPRTSATERQVPPAAAVDREAGLTHVTRVGDRVTAPPALPSTVAAAAQRESSGRDSLPQRPRPTQGLDESDTEPDSSDLDREIPVNAMPEQPVALQHNQSFMGVDSLAPVPMGGMDGLGLGMGIDAPLGFGTMPPLMTGYDTMNPLDTRDSRRTRGRKRSGAGAEKDFASDGAPRRCCSCGTVLMTLLFFVSTAAAIAAGISWDGELSRRTRAENTLKRKEAQFKAVQDKLALLNQSLDMKETALQTTDQNHQNLVKQVASLNSDLAKERLLRKHNLETIEELKTKNAHLTGANSNCGEATKRVAALEKENKDLTRQVAELERQLVEYGAGKLVDEVQRLKTEITNLQSGASVEQQNLSQLRQEKAAAEASVRQLQQELVTLKTRADETSEAKIAQKDQQILGLNDEIMRLNARVATLNERLQARLEQQKVDGDAGQKRIAEALLDKERLTQKVEALQAEVDKERTSSLEWKEFLAKSVERVATNNDLYILWDGRTEEERNADNMLKKYCDAQVVRRSYTADVWRKAFVAARTLYEHLEEFRKQVTPEPVGLFSSMQHRLNPQAVHKASKALEKNWVEKTIAALDEMNLDELEKAGDWKA